MKIIKYILSFLVGAVFFGGLAYAQSIPSQSPWFYNASGYITQIKPNATINITGLSDGCLGLISGLVTSNGVVCGSGSGNAPAFTPTSWGASTSTTLGFLNGFLSTASSTINASLFITNLAQGLLFNGTNGLISSVSTSTLSASSPLTGSFIQIGSSGSLGCQTASGSQAGCLTSTDWNTFNNKQSSISATWPILLSGSTLSFGGLSTTSNLTQGFVPYVTGVNTFGQEATGTASGAGVVTVTGSRYLLNGAATFDTAPGTFSGAGTYNFPQALGVSSSTPWGFLSVNPTAGLASNEFVVGSSTATAFVINNSGNVGVGTTSPGTVFSVGNSGGLSFNPTATSTFGSSANGLNIMNGCYALGGVCLTAGILGGGTTQAANWATTGVLGGTPTYNNGTAGVGGTLTEIGTGALSVDSSSPASGDRVLVKNQASAFQNGIYTVTATGSGIASYILTRATDYNSPSEITPGISTYVLTGTSNTDTTWAVSYTAPLTLGTTNLTYTETANGVVTFPISIANGGTNATSMTTSGNSVYYDGTRLATALTTTKVTTPYASSTAVTASNSFTFGTTTQDTSRGIGGAFGTSTIVGAQFGFYMASSTCSTGACTVDWANDSTSGSSGERFILTGNISLTMNATSSHPISGIKELEMCQDGTGSHTLTFVDPTHLRWGSLGTTTISSTANTCTNMLFQFEPYWLAGIGEYMGLASTTSILSQ
jgi:hypothetical protein